MPKLAVRLHIHFMFKRYIDIGRKKHPNSPTIASLIYIIHIIVQLINTFIDPKCVSYNYN